MSDYNKSFPKIDQKCSNIYLIDEMLCLANSLGVMNYNFQSLSGAIKQIDSYSNYMNSVYTLFTVSSASWFEAFHNIENNKDKWNSYYTVVQNNSSYWDNEFSVYYTTIYEINDWNSNSSTYINSDVLNWLNLNFPTSDYPDNQIISVYVNAYVDFNFDILMNYGTHSTHHDCHVPSGGGTVSCSHDCPRPFRGCNHHGGAAGEGPCDNAYSYCGTNTTGAAASWNCPGYGETDLILSQTQGTSPVPTTNYSDRYIAKNFRIRYKKLPNKIVWTSI